MQPMGSRQLAQKDMRCNGFGGLYGGDVGILSGPGIASDAFRFLYRKSGGMVTCIGPSMRAHASIADRMQTCSEITKHAIKFIDFLEQRIFRLLGIYICRRTRQPKIVMGPLTEATEFPIHPSLQQRIQAADRSWRLSGRLQSGRSGRLRLN